MPTKTERIQRAFELFDTDGNGSLSIAELKAVLTRPGGGHALTDKEVTAIIAEFDANGDGELQIDEFALMWGPLVEQQQQQQQQEEEEEEEEEDEEDDDTPLATPSTSFIRRLVKGATKDKGKGKAKSKKSSRAKGKLTAKPSKAKSARAASLADPSVDEKAAAKGSLQSSVELEVLAEEEMRALGELEARLAAGGLDTFERRLGAALLEEATVKHALAGKKSALLELVRLMASPECLIASHIRRRSAPDGISECISDHPRRNVLRASLTTSRTASRTASLIAPVIASLIAPVIASLIAPVMASLIAPVIAYLIAPVIASRTAPRTASLIAPVIAHEIAPVIGSIIRCARGIGPATA